MRAEGRKTKVKPAAQWKSSVHREPRVVTLIVRETKRFFKKLLHRFANIAHTISFTVADTDCVGAMDFGEDLLVSKFTEFTLLAMTLAMTNVVVAECNRKGEGSHTRCGVRAKSSGGGQRRNE